MTPRTPDLNDFEAFVTGNQNALAFFYDHYYLRVLNWVLPFLKSYFDADEVVLESFLELWRSRESITDLKHLEGLLFRIAKNKALGRLRSPKESFEILENLGSNGMSEKPALEVKEALEQAARSRKLFQIRLHLALKKLSKKNLQIIKMEFYDKPPLPTMEKAKTIGLKTEKSYYTAKGRALKKLKKLAAKELEQPPPRPSKK